MVNALRFEWFEIFRARLLSDQWPSWQLAHLCCGECPEDSGPESDTREQPSIGGDTAEQPVVNDADADGVDVDRGATVAELCRRKSRRF